MLGFPLAALRASARTNADCLPQAELLEDLPRDDLKSAACVRGAGFPGQELEMANLRMSTLFNYVTGMRNSLLAIVIAVFTGCARPTSPIEQATNFDRVAAEHLLADAKQLLSEAIRENAAFASAETRNCEDRRELLQLCKERQPEIYKEMASWLDAVQHEHSQMLAVIDETIVHMTNWLGEIERAVEIGDAESLIAAKEKFNEIRPKMQRKMEAIKHTEPPELIYIPDRRVTSTYQQGNPAWGRPAAHRFSLSALADSVSQSRLLNCLVDQQTKRIEWVERNRQA